MQRSLLLVGALVLRALASANTEALFVPSSPDVGPFPTDSLTVVDNTQATRKRVNLPKTNCAVQPTSCAETDALNQLDGFSINPRVRVCFSGPVAVDTLSSGVFLQGAESSQRIAINQIFYDPATNCMSAKPDAVLDSGRTYTLLVTKSVRDARGKAVKRSRDFQQCLAKRSTSYCADLAAALRRGDDDDDEDEDDDDEDDDDDDEKDGDEDGDGRGRIVAASRFTTLSARNWMEKARAFVSAPTAPAVVMPVGPAEGFPVAAISKFQWFAQTHANGALTENVIPTKPLEPHVGRVAFGLLLSPNFISFGGPAPLTIPATSTGGPIAQPSAPPIPIPAPPGYLPVSFHVFLPSSPKPANGYPVAIYIHGITDSQFGAATTAAATLAKRGIATLALEVFGHGFGSNSFVRLTVGGQQVDLPTPGRGLPLPQNAGAIGPLDGCVAAGAYAVRDCFRQTAVDVIALMRAIERSNGYFGQLDRSRMYLLGQSFGAIVGTLVAAVEPNVRATVLNVPGGSSVDIARLEQNRLLALAFLRMRTPPLLNDPQFGFNDNYAFRDTRPVVNNVPGAPAIQAAFDSADWLHMPGDALAFASALRGKRVLIQFARGDEEVANPTTSALIRTANARSSSRYFLFNRAQAVAGPQLPLQPHRFMATPEIYLTPERLAIAMAAQEQVAGFLQSNGNFIPDANGFLGAPFTGMRLFETPATLPESLNFVRRPLQLQ